MLVPFTVNRPVFSGMLATTMTSFFFPLPTVWAPWIDEVKAGDADPVAPIIGFVLVAEGLDVRRMVAGCTGCDRCDGCDGCDRCRCVGCVIAIAP